MTHICVARPQWNNGCVRRYGAKPTEHLKDISLTGDWSAIKSETSGILEVHWEQAENNVLEIFLYGNQMADDTTVYMKLEFQSAWKTKHEW